MVSSDRLMLTITIRWPAKGGKKGVKKEVL